MSDRAPDTAEIKAFLARMASWREDARHAIKKEPEHMLVQRLQEGANLGYEAADLWRRLEYCDPLDSPAPKG